MTIDDLLKVYLKHDSSGFSVDNTVAGIRAVVIALRETFGLAYSEGRMSMVRGNNENHQRQWVDALINEILASDGVEAAGGPARKDGRTEGAEVTQPATSGPPTPAAAYCPSCLNPLKSEAAR